MSETADRNGAVKTALSIRRATPADAAAFCRHLGDPAIVPGLLMLPYQSVEFWQKRLTDGALAGSADVLLVAERDGGELIGHASLWSPGPHARRRHVMGLGIAVSPEAQRRGVGSALMSALCDYADRWAGVLRLELTVYADNTAAIRLYEKFGFVHEGTARAYALRDGVYVDARWMARLHPQPPSLPAPARAASAP